MKQAFFQWRWPALLLLAFFLASPQAAAQSAGDVDVTFNPSTIDGAVHAIQPLDGGKTLIGGAFRSVGGETRERIAQLHPDGTLDLSFTPAHFFGQVNSLALQSDGRILVGGNNYITRLNADGTQDSGFGAGLGGPNGSVRAVVLQDNGKILLGGSFGMIRGENRLRIARLNADGSLDSAFGEGLAGANSIVLAVAVQDDGKILLGGGFSSIHGETRHGIARLNADGTLDDSFGEGLAGANLDVHAIAVQDGERTLIGGRFTSVNGVIRGRIARLNVDGTVDTSFGDGLAGANGTVWSIVVREDGKLLIGGEFTSVNGVSRGRIARLHPDGTLDTSFGDGESGVTGINQIVYSIERHDDRRILIGGLFSSVNGIARNRVARLFTEQVGNQPTDHYTYDETGRLIGAYYSNGVTITYLYGPAGSLWRRTVSRFVDTDGNGIDDAWEMEHFGEIGIDPDAPSASPGMTVLQEFLAGTDPNDPADFLRVIELRSGAGIGFQIDWPAIAGRVYRVQFTDTLLPHDWRDLPGDIVADGQIATKTDETAHEAAKRFYRVVVLQQTFPWSNEP